MSPPAMIDTCSPPASSAHQFQFGNPSKVQIPTSPALDQSTMDPAPPSTSGLSKPRLVKVRRQAASPRVRPPSAPDRPPLAGFNPFPASSADVRDRLCSWKPFVAEAGNISVSNSIGASSNNVNSVRSGSANFVFGASTKTDGLASTVGGGLDDQLMSRLPDEIGKLNLQSASTETTRKNAFVFGCSVKDGSNLSQSASLGADDGSGSLSWLPDGISKMKLSGGNEGLPDGISKMKLSGGNEGLPDGISKMKLSGGNEGLERIHQAEGKASVVGGSKKTSNEGVRNSDPGVSVFGSGRTNFHQRGLDVDLLTRLPIEMKELNLQSTDSQHDMGTNGSFVFGGSKGANGERAQSSDPSTFIFGSGVKIGSNLSGNSSFGGSDDGSFTHLPDEMRKQNLQNAGKKHDFQKTKSTSAKFGISENVPNFSGNGVTNKLTDDMVKLKIRNEAAARDKKDGLDCSAGIFVPGSNSKGSRSPTTFSTSLDKGMTSDLPNDPKKWDGQGPRHDFDSRNARESETGDRVDLGPDFVFGNSNSASVACGGTAGKYNLGNRSENMVSGKQHVFRTDGLRTTEPSSFKFTFQAGKQDYSSNTGFTQHLRTHENINPAPVVTSSCFASSPTPPVESGFTSKSTQEGFGTSQFRIPKQDAFCFSEENLCANLRQSMAFSMKEEAKGTKTRKRRGKSRQRAPVTKQSSLKENVTLENSEHESVGGYSPMDYSPYRENIVADQCSAETSVASDESFHLSYRCSSNDSHISSSMDGMNEKSSVSVDGTEERLASAAQHMTINDDDVKYGKLNEAGLKESVERNFSSGFSFAEKTSELGNLSLPTESESGRFDNNKRVAPERNFSSEFSFVEKTSELGNSSLPTEPESARFDNDKRTAAERSFSSGFSVVERTSELGNSSLPTEYECARLDNDKRTASFEAETAGTFTSNNTKEAGEGRSSFTFASRLEDYSNSNLTFVTSPAEQGPLSASKPRYRRKSRSRTVQDSYNCTVNDKVPLASASPHWFPVASSSVDPDPQQGTTNILFNLKTKNENRVDKNIEPDAIQDPVTTVSASIMAKEACEKWRLRGNQAYANGLLSKAEEYYTRGVNSISLNETSKSCIQALMLCHSNRAATRMSLGRMREAIGDCKIALAIDPNFLRAQVRTGNCYLALGEIEEALKHFKKCLQSDSGVNCDKKILSEASEGLKKAQQVGDCMGRSIEFLLKRNRNDATIALQIISEALLISPNSEKLLEMKAEALLMARSYEEVIQMCEHTLDSSEKNSVVTGDKMQLKDVNNSENPKVSPERLWRWRLISMSYFYLGKFEEALELLQKHEKVKPIAGRFCNNSQEPPRKLSVTISELLRLKAAGNEAFQAGKHLEAIEHYTSALACNTESRSFTAICFCNRAAAYQALDQITYAIADCSLAIALNSSYPKAISRRATFYEMIRDYGQAVNDLNRLISLLEKQSEDGDVISGETVRSSRNCNDLKRARIRLFAMEEEARKGIPLDMYMILGVERTSSAADVKKAYRKAALRHHPDKAGHYLTRSENINDGLWREVAVEVHTDADRLFKMIGEAYAILSDSAKRQQYDEEEEMRKSIKKKGYTPRSRGDGYGSQYDRGFERRQWQPYGNSHHRWSESSYSDW